MIQAPSVFLAFTAGLLSFLSPCCLPLVPGYLATVCGQDPSSRDRSVGVLTRAVVFVATFSLLFVVLGLTATLAGQLLSDNRRLLDVLAGSAVLTLGTFFLRAAAVPALNRSWQPLALVTRAGRGAPVITGGAFALAWTPCIGPTLGAILSLAATTAGTAQGGLLLAIYSAGLAVPFLWAAVAFGAASRTFAFLRRHTQALHAMSGIMLIAMGLLVLTGQLTELNIHAQRLLNGLGLDFLNGL